MAAAYVPLDFPGLTTTPDRAFTSPNMRVRIKIYPIPDASPFVAKSRSALPIVIDWTDSTVASVIKLMWSKALGVAAGTWSAVLKEREDSAVRLEDLSILDGDWVDITVLRNGVEIPLLRGVVDSVREARTSMGGVTVVTHTLSGRDHGSCFEYPITWSSMWCRTLSELVSGLFTRRIEGRVGGRPDELFSAIIKGTFAGAANKVNPGGQWVLPAGMEGPQPVQPPPVEFDYADNSINLKDPTGAVTRSRLYDVLKVITFDAVSGTAGLRGAYYNEPGIWAIGEQDLHTTLNEWVNPLLNEHWYDLIMPQAFTPRNGLHKFLSSDTDAFKARDGGQSATSAGPATFSMGAFCRERPFPTVEGGYDSMWFNLPTWTLPSWVCSTTDLGRGGHERYNLFELLAQYGLGPTQEQAAFAAPVWLFEDIQARGLRVHSDSTKFFADKDGGGPGVWYATRNSWGDLIRDWLAPNPYLRNGGITAKLLLPEIRVGQRLILDRGDPELNEQFYVEAVSGTWMAATATSGASGSTQLTVTRGFKGTDQSLLAATTRLTDAYRTVF